MPTSAISLPLTPPDEVVIFQNVKSDVIVGLVMLHNCCHRCLLCRRLSQAALCRYNRWVSYWDEPLSTSLPAPSRPGPTRPLYRHAPSICRVESRINNAWGAAQPANTHWGVDAQTDRQIHFRDELGCVKPIP